MTELRKVFICKSCEAVYADDPVTECDCMQLQGNADEFEQAYIVGEDTRKMVLELCNLAINHAEIPPTQWARMFIEHSQKVLERLEAGE